MAQEENYKTRPLGLRHYQIEEGEKHDDGDINIWGNGTTLFVYERGN